MPRLTSIGTSHYALESALERVPVAAEMLGWAVTEETVDDGVTMTLEPTRIPEWDAEDLAYSDLSEESAEVSEEKGRVRSSTRLC